MNHTGLVSAALQPELQELLRLAGAVAERRHMSLFLVGGSVRDILLGRSVVDLDFTVEGDASMLAHDLAKTCRGSVVAQSQFGTAKVDVGQYVVDLATARKETYGHPGALPRVAQGSINDDLVRRDFTINAMAIPISSQGYGDILDVTGGANDIKLGLVRILHDESFKDDATRMLRAIRYEQRLGFQLQEQTEQTLYRDCSYLDSISADRLRHELERLLSEPEPARDLLRADQLGILAAIYPPLAEVNRWRDQLWAHLNPKPDLPLLYLAFLAWIIPDEAVQSFIARFNFTTTQSRVITDTKRMMPIIRGLDRPGIKPSEIYEMLTDIALEAVRIALLLIDKPMACKYLERYIHAMDYVTPDLNGMDLMKMGVAEGPQVGELLSALRRARLDGEVCNRAQEKALIKKRIASH